MEIKIGRSLGSTAPKSKKQMLVYAGVAAAGAAAGALGVPAEVIEQLSGLLNFLTGMLAF